MYHSNDHGNLLNYFNKRKIILQLKYLPKIMFKKFEFQEKCALKGCKVNTCTDKVVYGMYDVCFIKWLSIENKYTKNYLSLIFFSKYTVMFTLHDSDLRSTTSYLHLVVMLNNGKANLFLFKVDTFPFHTPFMSFNPSIKCTFIPFFVKFLYNVLCGISKII